MGLLVGIGAIYTTAADLNLLLTGEREAIHLGVDVTRVKLVVYVSASLLTALAVSASGAIGYVGCWCRTRCACCLARIIAC